MAYVTIDGEKYEKELLDLAKEYTTGKGESRISKEEVEGLFKSALDGRGVTETEMNTLKYIRANFTFIDAAAAMFDEKITAL
jgi:hypothetical protein